MNLKYFYKFLRPNFLLLMQFLFFGIFYQEAFAEDSYSAQSKIYLSGGLLVSRGTAGSNDSLTAKSRSMWTSGAEIILGYRFGQFSLGAGSRYSYWRQITDPSEVYNSNMQGKQLQIGPVLVYEIAFLNFLVRYNLSDTYSTDQNDLSGQTIKYTGATSYNVQIRAQQNKNYSWGIDYSYGQYKKLSVNGSTSDLGTKTARNFSSYGLIFGWNL